MAAETSEFWRHRAERVRHLARGLLDETARQRLFELADEYDMRAAEAAVQSGDRTEG